MPFNTFVSNLKNMWYGTDDLYKATVIPQLLSGNSFDISKADQLAAVYTCVKTLSDTLSRMPLNVYIEDQGGRTVDKTDYRYSLLHFNPNNYTSSQVFFAALEYYRNLRGNSFARIYRDKQGFVTSLEIISPSLVEGYSIQNGELYYKVREINPQTNAEKIVILNANELLHFRAVTKDGIWGITPIEALRLNVSTTWQALNTVDNFYRNNASSAKAIKSTVSGSNQKAMLDAITDLQKKYSGSANAGQIIPLPPNTELQDLSMNLADQEFLATIKFNTGQIAALYGIPPEMVGIYEASKWNNVEQMQLNFKAQTLTAIARMYRQELEFKLLTSQERLNGKTIEFNLMALVEADSTTRINNMRVLLEKGVMTPNQAAIIEGLSTFEGGDEHYLPTGYTSIESRAKMPVPPAPKNQPGA